VWFRVGRGRSASKPQQQTVVYGVAVQEGRWNRGRQRESYANCLQYCRRNCVIWLGRPMAGLAGAPGNEFTFWVRPDNKIQAQTIGCVFRIVRLHLSHTRHASGLSPYTPTYSFRFPTIAHTYCGVFHEVSLRADIVTNALNKINLLV
jgi:hypothetical protein